MGEDAPAARAPPKAGLSRSLPMIVFLTSFIVVFDEGLRTGLGLAAGALFSPAIGFGGSLPVLTLLLAGMITSILSSLVRHRFTDWVRMARINKQTRAVSRALMDSMRKGQSSKAQKLRTMQAEVRKETFDVQGQSMVSLAITSFPFIAFFAWLSIFIGEVVMQGRVFFAVPWSPHAHLLTVYGLFPSWLLLYILLAIPIGQISSRLLKYASFRKRLAAVGSEGA